MKVIVDPPSLLTDSILKTVFRKYNVNSFQAIAGADGSKQPISEHGELDAKHYVNSKNEVIAVVSRE